MDNLEEGLISIKQAVEYTGYTRNTLGIYRSKGIIKGHLKPGNQKELFYKAEELDIFLKTRRSLNKYKGSFKHRCFKLKAMDLIRDYWCIDGNMWSKRFYSELEAEKLSKTMVNSFNNTNCSNLVNCTNCEDCNYCENCKNAKGLSHKKDKKNKNPKIV